MRIHTVAILVVLFSVQVSAGEPELRLLTGTVTDEFDKPIPGALVEWAFFSASAKDRESVLTRKDGSFRLETRKYGPDFRLGASAEGWGPRWRDGLIPSRMDAPKPYVLKLLKPVEVTGKVLDDYGKPIAGAVVIAQSESTGFHSSFSMPTPSYVFPGPAHEATTATDGSFVIRNLPRQEAASFFAPRPAPNPATPQHHYKFALLVRSGTGMMPRGTALPGEPATIRISREYATAAKGTGVLRAHVFDQATGRSITNFRVVRRHIPGMVDHEHPDGEFSFDRLIVGRRNQVFVYADGYAPFVFREEARSYTDAKVIECPMKSAAGLTAVVVDEANHPIEGAEVVAGVVPERHAANRFYWGDFEKYVDGYMGWEKVQRTTTDSEGRFHVCEDDSKNALAIMAPGYARRFVNVADRSETGDNGLVTIRVQKESRLEGIVKKDGEPESDARLRLSREDFWQLDFGELKAERNGRFKIGQLQPGDYSFSVYQYSGNTGTTRLSRTIHLLPGQTLRIDMERPDGQFTLKGKAPPFALIGLRAKKEQPYMHVGTTADVNGEYEIGGLRKGRYEFSVHRPSALSGLVGRGRSEEIDIHADSQHDAKTPFLFPPR